VAVASDGLYASLHLIPDNHANIPPLSFLQAGCPSCRPTNSVKALKANKCVAALPYEMTDAYWTRGSQWTGFLQHPVETRVEFSSIMVNYRST